MIFQFTAYYGAVINDKVTYSMELTMEDCKVFPTEPFSDDEIKKFFIQKIENDGHDSSLFTYRWLTMEEYASRPESTVENFPFSID